MEVYLGERALSRSAQAHIVDQRSTCLQVVPTSGVKTHCPRSATMLSGLVSPPGRHIGPSFFNGLREGGELLPAMGLGFGDAEIGMSSGFCEIQKPAVQPTANSAKRNLTAVMAVPHPRLWEKSAASIGSNGSASSGDFSEIEATIHRPCDARSDDGWGAQHVRVGAPTRKGFRMESRHDRRCR